MRSSTWATRLDPMSTDDFELGPVPTDRRARELWLQHAAGFILFEDARAYAVSQIDPALKDEAKAAARKAVDDALYGLMMIIDGVSGGLQNDEHRVSLDVVVRLDRHDSAREAPVDSVHLFHGDGMCMGFHGWREGDFGSSVVAKRRPGLERDDKTGR